MCKLLTILDIENQALAEKFVRVAVPILTKNDNDGLGIMRLGENGISGQRWVTIPHSLKRGEHYPSKYAAALQYESNEFGEPSKHYRAIAVHGRQATNEISIRNTHPFVAGGTALIHNGVVTSSNGGNKLSTCDSEILLWRYIDGGVLGDPSKLSEALDDVSGYYACIVFNASGVVDIWRDSSATLFLAHIAGLGTVISTTAEIIRKTARVLKLKILSLDPILPFSFIRWESNKDPLILTFSKPVETLPAHYGKYAKEFEEFDRQNGLKENHWWEEEKKKELEERNSKFKSIHSVPLSADVI